MNEKDVRGAFDRVLRSRDELAKELRLIPPAPTRIERFKERLLEAEIAFVVAVTTREGG